MKAMILDAPGQLLQYRDIPDPVPGPGQVLVKVAACGVCRTDLHVVDGDLTEPHLPIIPGHEIVGRVEAIGAGVGHFTIGDRVGIPWLGHTCGECFFCRSSQENLCDAPLFTGTDQWRLCRLHSRGGRVLLSAARELRRRGGGPAVVCGADRPSRTAYDGGCQGASASTALVQPRISSPRLRNSSRSVYAFIRPGDSKAQDVSRSLGPRVGRRLRRAHPAPPWMRQSSSRPSATWYRARSKWSAKAASLVLRWHSHERDYRRCLTGCCGEEQDHPLGRQPYSQRCARVWLSQAAHR